MLFSFGLALTETDTPLDHALAVEVCNCRSSTQRDLRIEREREEKKKERDDVGSIKDKKLKALYGIFTGKKTKKKKNSSIFSVLNLLVVHWY